MVLCVKYRKKLLLRSERVIRLKEICSEIGKRYWFQFDAVGTDGDHVHIFIGSEPKYAPSKVMQIIKSIAAKQIFKDFPEIRKELWGGEFWSDGGYIGTVGEGVTAEIIRDYIEKQGTTEEKEGYKQMNLLEFD
jgi:REP-associated tyrosine transposase